GPMGFEPTTSDVTGRRSNRAELRPRCEPSFVPVPVTRDNLRRSRVSRATVILVHHLGPLSQRLLAFQNLPARSAYPKLEARSPTPFALGGPGPRSKLS